MESETNDSPELLRIQLLENEKQSLRDRLYNERKKSSDLENEVRRLCALADDNREKYITVGRMFRQLSADATLLMQENGAEELHKELQRLRQSVERRQEMLVRRRELTRRAVKEMEEARQQTRDYAAVVEQLNKRIAETEQQRDDAVQQAQDIIEQRDRQTGRFRDWCESWYKGEVGADEVVAGITAELRGNTMPEVSEIERRRAVHYAETMSQMAEATEQLEEIARIVGECGIDRVNTTKNMVRDLVNLYQGRGEQVDEWKGWEAKARGACMQLLGIFGYSEETFSAKVQAGQYDEVIDEVREEYAAGTPTSAVFAQLIGVSDAAAIIGCSRQRALQFIQEKRLTVKAHLSSGPVLWRADVEEFAKMPRPAGRRPKNQAKNDG